MLALLVVIAVVTQMIYQLTSKTGIRVQINRVLNPVQARVQDVVHTQADTHTHTHTFDIGKSKREQGDGRCVVRITYAVRLAAMSQSDTEVWHEHEVLMTPRYEH